MEKSVCASFKDRNGSTVQNSKEGHEVTKRSGKQTSAKDGSICDVKVCATSKEAKNQRKQQLISDFCQNVLSK